MVETNNLVCSRILGLQTLEMLGKLCAFGCKAVIHTDASVFPGNLGLLVARAVDRAGRGAIERLDRGAEVNRARMKASDSLEVSAGLVDLLLGVHKAAMDVCCTPIAT